MTTIDQDQLAATLADARAKAEAFPEEQRGWEYRQSAPTMGGAVWTLRAAGLPGIRAMVTEYQHGTAYADHIARMDPATTLLLLDAVETLRAENERLEMLLRTMDHWADVAERVERKANESHARREAAEAEAADLRTRLANVRAQVLDPVHVVTEGPLIGRLKVAGMLDRALEGPQDGGDGR